MTCKGICNRLKATKPIVGGRYIIGQKRCQPCTCFFLTDSLFCPCCNQRLRNKPRSKKYKEKLREKNER